MQPKQNNCASVVRQLDQQTVKGNIRGTLSLVMLWKTSTFKGLL